MGCASSTRTCRVTTTIAPVTTPRSKRTSRCTGPAPATYSNPITSHQNNYTSTNTTSTTMTSATASSTPSGEWEADLQHALRRQFSRNSDLCCYWDLPACAECLDLELDDEPTPITTAAAAAKSNTTAMTPPLSAVLASPLAQPSSASLNASLSPVLRHPAACLVVGSGFPLTFDRVCAEAVPAYLAERQPQLAELAASVGGNHRLCPGCHRFQAYFGWLEAPEYYAHALQVTGDLIVLRVVSYPCPLCVAQN